MRPKLLFDILQFNTKYDKIKYFKSIFMHAFITTFQNSTNKIFSTTFQDIIIRSHIEIGNHGFTNIHFTLFNTNK